MDSSIVNWERELENIFRAHNRELVYLSYNILKNKEEAEDIVQEVFFRFWTRKEIKVESSLKAYLFVAVRNLSLDRKRSSGYKILSGAGDDFSSLTPAKEVEEMENYLELEKKYEVELGKLPEKCREVFLLSREKELTYKEIAAKLNISVKTVENQMGKALKLLREGLLLILFILLFS